MVMEPGEPLEAPPPLPVSRLLPPSLPLVPDLAAPIVRVLAVKEGLVETHDDSSAPGVEDFVPVTVKFVTERALSDTESAPLAEASVVINLPSLIAAADPPEPLSLEVIVVFTVKRGLFVNVLVGIKKG